MEYNSCTPGVALRLMAGTTCLLSLVFGSTSAVAEYALNFTPLIANPTQSQSVANIGCKDGVSTVGGHHRTEFSCGDGIYFMQEVITEGNNTYYHVIIGDPVDDAFSQEFYIRGAGCCWFTEKGPAWNPMYGEAPLSASYGDTGKLLSSAFFPLAPVTLSGNGSGNPNRVYMKQINQDNEMYLEFEKSFEDKKPRITQVIDDGEVVSEFILDNSNAGYSESIAAGEYKNTLTLLTPEKTPLAVGGYDIAKEAPDQVVTGGLYTYVDGPEPEGAFGMYFYVEAEYDPVYIDWLAYCNPEENTFRGCVGGPGPGGSGPGGPGANLRAGQEEWWATHTPL